MDLTRIRSLFTWRGCNELVLCCRGELFIRNEYKEDVSVHASPARLQTIFLSHIILMDHFFPLDCA